MSKSHFNEQEFEKRKKICDENEKGIFQSMIFNQMRIK